MLSELSTAEPTDAGWLASVTCWMYAIAVVPCAMSSKCNAALAHVIADAPCAGGICPGVNSVIEGMVKRLADYGVEEVSKGAGCCP